MRPLVLILHLNVVQGVFKPVLVIAAVKRLDTSI
jgi:hypothetical protein